MTADILGVLCILVVVVGVVTLVGHGLWLLFAALGRALGGGGTVDSVRQSSEPASLTPCVRCGYGLQSWERRCPRCRLHCASTTATELRELEATARQIQRFLQQGVLDQETCDRLYQSIEARQHALMKDEPAAAFKPAARRPSVATPVDELERLLAGCEDVRNLTLGNRQRALACYRQTSHEDLAALSLPTQLTLARLLTLAGLITRSLQTYHLLLETHPELPNFVEAAMEAARCAEWHNDSRHARWFLELALARPLSPELRAEAEAMLAKCRPAATVAAPAEEEILDVLPVEPAPAVEPSPVREKRPAVLPPVKVLEAPPPRPRRSLGQVLAAFMEERNILWGELVGGLLIVGCSIALVISLWQRLEQIPYFPFLIFAFTTAALGGAGLYTLHRWKLQTTSRGLLVISMLLVPLNFLVLAGLTKGQAGGLLEFGVEGVALAVFAGLVSQAAKVVADPEMLPGVKQGRWLLTVAVVGASGAQLLVPRLLDLTQPAPWLFYLVALLPVACHSMAVGAVLHGSRRHLFVAEFARIRVGPPPNSGEFGYEQERQANAIFAFLGIAVFALAVAIGFLIYWSDDIASVLHRLSVLIALATIPALVAGMLIYNAPDLSAPARTGGSAVALAGAAVMLIAIALAWPQPLALIGVCVLDFAVLTILALRGRLPLAHAAALPCLAVAWLTGFHLIVGSLNVPANELAMTLLRQAVSSESGVALMGLVLFVALVSELLVRADPLTLPSPPSAGGEGRVRGSAHVVYYAAGCAVGAVLSLILVTLHGQAEPDRAAVVYGVIGIGCLVANYRRHWWQLTYVGTTLILGSLLFLVLDWPLQELALKWRLLIALLVHAFVFLLYSVGLIAVEAGRLSEPPLNRDQFLDVVFVIPFRRAALVSTLLALPLLPFVLERNAMAWLTLYVGLVAAAWLVISWLERWPVLFSAFQAALTVTFVLGTTAILQIVEWPQGEKWITSFPSDLLAARSLHVYGIALAVLGLLWAAARMALRSNESAQELLEPPWPAVDRVVLTSMITGQFLLACLGILPGVIDEFRPTTFRLFSQEWINQAHGISAWALLVSSVLTLAFTLWGRRPASVTLGLVLLAVTAPVLIAGRFGEQLATASALRWGLAICYLLLAIPLWLRGLLARRAASLGVRFDTESGLSTAARWLLLWACVAPVLILTVIRAAMAFAGERPAGPLAGTFFREMGFNARHLVPLGLISLTMVGHALRERSAGYAFTAGLIANATVTSGYALNIVLGGGSLGSAEWVHLLQLAVCCAAAWAIAWLSVRRFGLHLEGDAGWQLRLLQVGMGNVLLVVPLITAIYLLIVPFPVLDPESTTAIYLAAPAWTMETGTLPSWLALTLAVIASALYSLWRERAVVSTELVGLAGLALVGLLACTVERLAAGWGYRTLMVGLAGIALAAALALGRLPALRWQHVLAASENLRREVDLTCLAGLPALGLAIKAALAHQDPLWAAGVSALLAVAAATLAFHRRQEAWAFVSVIGVSLAVSLVVWHAHFKDPLGDWWIGLVQANIISTSAGALLWLVMRRRIYEQPELTFSTSPLLGVQITLGMLANGMLLLIALGWLLVKPAGPMPGHVLEAGQVTGWLALLLATGASVWYVRLVGASKVIHAVGLGGGLFAILTACFAAQWDQSGWLAHHVLTVGWSLLGLVLLAAGWTGNSVQRLGPAFWSEERRVHAAELLATFFPARPTRRWVEILGLLVVGLALRGAWNDPARPYWSSAATLGVSAMAGALAVWSRRPGYVYASGLLFNVVGILAWQAWLIEDKGIAAWFVWGPDVLSSFLYTNVLCLALASAFWTALELTLRHRTPPLDLRSQSLPFTQVAALVALQLLAVLILGGIASDLTATRMDASGAFAWIALLAALIAAALGLWDEQVRGWSRPGLQLYGAGLLAIGLALHGAHLEPRWLCWSAALALAGYVLLAGVIVAAIPRLSRLWQSLRLPDPTGPGLWFTPAQVLIAVLAIGLSTWISLGFETWPQRLAGPFSVALLIPAGILAAFRGRPTSAPPFPHVATLLLGVMVAAEVGWSVLDPKGEAPWLHRNVLLMVALALLAVVYGLGLARLLGEQGDWARCAKKMGPLLGAGALALLAVVLVQELLLYVPASRKTPMVLPAVITVAVALLVLIAGALCFAVVPGRDPFGLSERGRTLYVYAAEVLLVLMLIHLRLNIGEVDLSSLGRQWPLLIMAIAFLGVGVSELFDRWGYRVLAEPLRKTGIFLPLLPVLAFLLRPLTDMQKAVGDSVAGMQPLLRYLERMPEGYGMHALVWFLLGGLYTLVAVTQRSRGYALLAALAANFGLWVVLANQEGLGFLAHPQFWLIPLALILLAAEYVNRDRLTQVQAHALRYVALLMLYLSSTADMFIVGLGSSVVWAVLLALLAVAGVLAGILLRVRAFLYLGVSFLFLVIFSQIWHAAVNRQQTWVWWASGIALGVAILTLFAIFEKRRNDVLRLVEEIKKWD